MNLKGVDIGKVYHCEDKLKFIKETYGHAEEATIFSIIRMFNKMGSYEEMLGKDFNFFTKTETISMFEELRWTDRNTFMRNGALLKSYIKWSRRKKDSFLGKAHPMETINYQRDLTGAMKFESEYLKDFCELKQCMDFLLHFENTGAIDENQFLMSKAVLCLIWLGFEKEEIAHIQKTHVNVSEKKISFYEYEAKDVDSYIMDLCERAIRITSYRVQGKKGNEATKKYENNSFLIRSTINKRRNEHSPINIQVFTFNMFAKLKIYAEALGEEHPHYGKNLKFTGIHWSGIYSRIYEYEKSLKRELAIMQDLDFLSKVGRLERENKTGIRNIYHNYLKWKKHFYSDINE